LSWSPGRKRSTAAQLTIERYEPDEAIVTQGEPGDAFFVLSRGEAEVSVSGRAVRTLGEGDHFGELALLKDTPRSATIRALLPTEVYRLGRDDFFALCESERRSARRSSGSEPGATRPRAPRRPPEDHLRRPMSSRLERRRRRENVPGPRRRV
jgi:signal-transduction protein with cAMP-binding, CBS, and nucleotidyltransferase domain